MKIQKYTRLLIPVLALCLIFYITSCDFLFQDDSTPPPRAGSRDNNSSSSEAEQSDDSTSGTSREKPPATDPRVKPVPVGSTGDSSSGNFPFKFTEVDIYGNTVTEETLGEKQLFFIHLWATWCGPCIYEMPDLAELAKAYGDDVGFLALLDDYDSNIAGARRIVEASGVPDNFISIDAYTPGMRELFELVNSGYLPTTAIIDPSGNLLEQQLIGAYGPEYAGILDRLLDK